MGLPAAAPPRADGSGDPRRARRPHRRDTTGALRVLETSQPPGIYVPPGDTDLSLLTPSPTRTFCEWKGVASYRNLLVPGDRSRRRRRWSYDRPAEPYAAIAGYLAFYPQRVDACFVDDEQVASNEGSFYGGWITSTDHGPLQGRRRHLGLVALRSPLSAAPPAAALDQAARNATTSGKALASWTKKAWPPS